MVWRSYHDLWNLSDNSPTYYKWLVLKFNVNKTEFIYILISQGVIWLLAKLFNLSLLCGMLSFMLNLVLQYLFFWIFMTSWSRQNFQCTYPKIFQTFMNVSKNSKSGRASMNTIKCQRLDNIWTHPLIYDPPFD